MAAANAAGVPPMTPQLMPMQADMMARLQSAANFDRAYAREQVMAHEMALRLHQNYAARGDAPALRAVASTAVPVVRQHLAMARRWPG
jgi:putative membrane protein